MSYLDWYFNGGEKKKKRSSVKTVTIKGRKYKVVAAARKSRRPKSPDLNGSGRAGSFYGGGNKRKTMGYGESMFDFGMNSQQSKPIGREPSIAQEYFGIGKGMYHTAKNIKDSPFAGFVAKKIKEHRTNKSFKSQGFSSSKVNLGSKKVGFLKPNKMELKELRGNSRIRETPY